MSSVFIEVPELDWLWDEAVQLTEEAYGTKNKKLQKLADRMRTLYKYLLWSRRYQTCPARDLVWQIANGMITKYHHRLYGIELTDYEEKIVEKASQDYRRARQQEKAGKPVQRNPEGEWPPRFSHHPSDSTNGPQGRDRSKR